jgi:hypothetical protein
MVKVRHRASKAQHACSPACCLLGRPQDRCLHYCCFQALRAHRPQRMAARAWCAQDRVRGQGQGLVQGQGRAAQPSSSSQTGRRRWMVTRGCARPPPCALICSSRLIRRSSVTCRPRPPRLSAPPPALQGNPGGGVQGRATLRRCAWADEAACAVIRPQHPGPECVIAPVHVRLSNLSKGRGRAGPRPLDDLPALRGLQHQVLHAARLVGLDQRNARQPLARRRQQHLPRARAAGPGRRANRPGAAMRKDASRPHPGSQAAPSAHNACMLGARCAWLARAGGARCTPRQRAWALALESCGPAFCTTEQGAARRAGTCDSMAPRRSSAACAAAARSSAASGVISLPPAPAPPPACCQ